MEEENVVKNDNGVVNNNSSNNKNAMMAVLCALIIILIGAVVYFAFIKKDDKPADNGGNNQQQENSQAEGENDNQVESENKNSLTSDENVESGVYGIAYIEGYAKVSEKSLCGDDSNECTGNEPKVNEVAFYVTNGKVDEIKEWFVTDDNGKDYLPLGCIENDLIKFDAMADEFYEGDNPNSQENYFREIELNKTDSEKIIASNENNPITLRVEKKQMKKNIRMGLYRCNSTITGVEVVK